MTGRCRLRSGTELGATSTSGASEVPKASAPEGCVHPRGCAARSSAQISSARGRSRVLADIAGPAMGMVMVEQGMTGIGHLAHTE